MQNSDNASEMRLFTPDGDRLYLTAEERRRFLDASALESPSNRMFCHVLHYSGCRPSEALAMTPRRVMINDSTIMIHSLKKYKTDQQSGLKQAQFRSIPVPSSLIEHLDLVFGLRSQLRRDFVIDVPLWSMSLPTAYRLIKRVMDRAGIVGAQATDKGLRHGFAVALVTANPPVPLHVINQLMGHRDSKTTEIYLQVLSE
ncbi:tyrosine-type recombinase/integrase [Shewanella cutis]|uniref:Tyrosine-type recombinase/integrase n=1 Tax=Shewanella cutis TaxID=2766780 RepID=A0ABS9R0E1_9GAMM|nr:tyrosine-type recombinase/integrase [Shewanella sp. PS-2]MCG9966073.1 tyrosine-type recombinase/integrase [Shewanella sp. PS-2]